MTATVHVDIEVSFDGNHRDFISLSAPFFQHAFNFNRITSFNYHTRFPCGWQLTGLSTGHWNLEFCYSSHVCQLWLIRD